MKLLLHPARLAGKFLARPSKSEAHRALICAAFADLPTVIRMQNTNSADIAATVRCLTALGAHIVQDVKGYTVTPLQTPVQNALLDCGESASTLRFLLPVVAAIGCGARFIAAGSLPQRPLAALLAALRGGGVNIESDRLPLRVSGQLRGGNFTLPGNISSQYFSGILFALTLSREGGSVRAETALESADYVAVTCDVLRRFGAPPQRQGGLFTAQAATLHTPGIITVRGDWSNAAFFLAAAALGGVVRCAGLCKDSLQGDRRVQIVLQNFGAKIAWEEGILCAERGKLCAVSEIDVRQIPDLVPVLAVVAAFSQGETRLIHAARLRLKESDRIKATAQMLRSLGGWVWEEEAGLRIQGQNVLRGGRVDCRGDHRIAMAAAVAAAACTGESILEGAQAVEKSYPAFFADYQKLGGSCHVLNHG